MNNLVQFFFGKNLPKNENIVQEGLYFIEAGKLYKGSQLVAEVNEVTAGQLQEVIDQVNALDKEIFVGTYAEYELALSNGEIVDGTVVHITDDGGSVNVPGGSGGMGSSSVQIVSKLPLASASYRGKFLILENENNDNLYICIKRNGIYQWFDITTGTTGLPGEEIPDIPETPDEPEQNADSTKAILGTGKLGQLVLGRE